MLLISTPLPPNKMDGRSTACETPRSARACSTAALPRKYGHGQSALGYVHDPPHASLGGREEQRARVGHRDLVADLPVREPHPVGVVEGAGAAQRLPYPGRVGEVQRPGFDGGAGRSAGGMTGERPYPTPGRLELARDGRPGVAERPGHDVEVGHRSVPTSAVSVWPRGASRVAVAYWSPRVAPWLTITTGDRRPAACRT